MWVNVCPYASPTAPYGLRDGVIADFNISSVASVFTTYVAATRVTGRDKLLIMRPFPASPFQKGNSIGRELLLRVWRGDHVDWEALRAKYLEERLCGDCSENKGKGAFTVGQWQRGNADRVCRECTARHRDAGEPYQCSICRMWFSEEAFPMKHRRNANSFYRVCHACELRKPCYICHTKKAESEYRASAWKSRNADRRVCTACAGAKKAKNCWTCAACGAIVSKLTFTIWCRYRPSGQDGTQVCDECYRAQAVRRIAGRARGRLREYRRQVRRRAIMEEVWKEIGAMVRARSRQPQHREADIPSHSHPQTVTSIKEFQPKDVSRSQTADNCKRRRKDGREIRSNEVRREVAAQARSRRTPSATPANVEPCPTRARRDSSPTSNPDAVLLDGQSIEKPTKNSASLHAYECPFCHMTVHSSLETGNVHVSGHCGKQFRVRDGEVTRAFTHACPKCGAEVSSTVARGKLGVSHRLPNGRPCPITRWTVK